jgi:hypothetical protein
MTTNTDAVKRLEKTMEIYREASLKVHSGQMDEAALPKLHANFARVLDETERTVSANGGTLSEEEGNVMATATWTYAILVTTLRMNAMVADGEPRPRQALLEEAQRRLDTVKTRT